MDFVIFPCLVSFLAGWKVFGFSNDAKQIKTLLWPNHGSRDLNQGNTYPFPLGPGSKNREN
jgi:hypothetical protein